VSFRHNGRFTLRKAFLSYKDDSGEPILSGIEVTQTGGTYRLLFNENNHKAVDTILIDVYAKLDAIGNWNDASVHYRYITIDDVKFQVKMPRHKENCSGRNITS
jgi:hypothetical protein